MWREEIGITEMMLAYIGEFTEFRGWSSWRSVVIDIISCHEQVRRERIKSRVQSVGSTNEEGECAVECEANEVDDTKIVLRQIEDEASSNLKVGESSSYIDCEEEMKRTADDWPDDVKVENDMEIEMSLVKGQYPISIKDSYEGFSMNPSESCEGFSETKQMTSIANSSRMDPFLNRKGDLANHYGKSAIVLPSSGLVNFPRGNDADSSDNLNCTFCDQTFDSLSAKIVHEIIHQGETSLGGARNNFPNSHYLPLKTEHVEKSLICKYCSKSFLDVKSKIDHERLHTGDRPYMCSYCEKNFTTATTKKEHERIHTGEKPYGCRFCSKFFTLLKTKVEHERLHTGEKPYGCKYCSKTFVQRSGRAKHERIHTREMRYQCKFCPEAFVHRGQQAKHERTHLITP